MSGTDHDALSQLLVEKDRELKQTMAVSKFIAHSKLCRVGTSIDILLFQLASRQGQVEKNIQALNVQVKKLDDAIKELQKKFKDAETVLATAIFQVLWCFYFTLSYLNPPGCGGFLGSSCLSRIEKYSSLFFFLDRQTKSSILLVVPRSHQ